MGVQIKETKHVVAYLDFLGIKKKIQDNDPKILSQLNLIYKKAQQNCQKVNNASYNENLPEIKQQIFSDNIVFAQRIIDENIVYQVFDFILFVSAYLHQALLAGFLVRGGITIGDMHIDNTFVLGKALVRAYKLESQIAIYPRVVLDFDVFGILSLLDDGIMRNLGLPTGDDFFYCIDAFRVIYKPSGYKIGYDVIRKAILETCTFVKDVKIMQKHLWIINQFNEFCQANNNEKYKINILKEYANVEQIVSV